MKALDTPTIIVIFGITGDLSRKKLIPAFLDLDSKGLFPKNFKIIGFARRDFSESSFSEFVRESILKRKHNHTKKEIDKFCSRLKYCPALFDDPVGYAKLGEKIIDLENKEFKQCANKLYYLATAPSFYDRIFRELAYSGLTIPCSEDKKWARILVEKPFGKDIDTAQSLDLLLGKLFKEEQVFRIDHYLAKEAVQNLILFRFSNALFEPLWNKDHIDRVEIRLLEKGGVGSRGSFYDSVGALRDVGQNHMLQMLSLIAMEEPEDLSSDAIREARAEALSSVRYFYKKNEGRILRARYKGYLEEGGVGRDSNTETYFKIYAEVKAPRWKGVPFMLESGKAMPESKTEIKIYFKPPEKCLACGKDRAMKECPHKNLLTFRIQPNEGITVRFWIKRPGMGRDVEPKELSFSYSDLQNEPELPDAYERLLYDAMTGDQTLFISTREVKAEWKFATPVMERWKDIPIVEYERGKAPK